MHDFGFFEFNTRLNSLPAVSTLRRIHLVLVILLPRRAVVTISEICQMSSLIRIPISHEQLSLYAEDMRRQYAALYYTFSYFKGLAVFFATSNSDLLILIKASKVFWTAH